MQHEPVTSSLTFGAVGVLQTEAGLVTFGHLGPVKRQQVVVGEHLDAVVVPEDGIRRTRSHVRSK